MITQSEMLAGVENPMSDKANNPLAGGLDYVDKVREHLETRPLHLQNVLIAIAFMRSNGVVADNVLYDIDIDALRWADLHRDQQFMQFMASDSTVHIDPNDGFAQITEMKHAGCRFRVTYGAAK